MTIGLWKGRAPLSIAAGICSANELLAKCAPKRRSTVQNSRQVHNLAQLLRER